jgi:DNA repair photolyase
MTATFVPLLPPDAIAALSVRAREVVEYRKSGLSLNHVQGCPLDCAYCIRHTYGLWDSRQPRALMPDDEAVRELIGHRYFRPHATPIQIFNRATDPFLPGVKDHLFAVLEDLDDRNLTNHTLVITRFKLTNADCARLSLIMNLKLTILFTYSGIDDKRIEPFPSNVSADSMKLATAHPGRTYRTVFYWRPLVPGLNDTPDHLAHAVELSRHADAAVFTGLFYRNEIADYYKANNVPEPYQDTARRKIVPETLETRVLEAFARHAGAGPLFRKTSCAVSHAHGLPDYNGHYGIPELCDICPLSQLDLCREAHTVPTADQLTEAVSAFPEAAQLRIADITNRAARIEGLPSEQPRYYLQHRFAFQIHDADHPHNLHRHGRAEIGWNPANDQRRD